MIVTNDTRSMDLAESPETKQTLGGTQSVACLTVEPEKYYVAVKGVPLKLTKTELLMIACLASNLNAITRLEDLWEFAWNREGPLNRKSIQGMISRLRSKVAKLGLRIDSIVDVGYILSHGTCCAKSED